jgi:hypothetical protein
MEGDAEGYCRDYQERMSGHPGMCCGQCIHAISLAEAQRDSALARLAESEASLKDSQMRHELTRDYYEQKMQPSERLSVVEQRLAEVEKENEALRSVFPDILQALNNGSGCTSDVSFCFIKQIPVEIRLHLAAARAEAVREFAECYNTDLTSRDPSDGMCRTKTLCEWAEIYLAQDGKGSSHG